jgi:hypothetical protein
VNAPVSFTVEVNVPSSVDFRVVDIDFITNDRNMGGINCIIGVGGGGGGGRFGRDGGRTRSVENGTNISKEKKGICSFYSRLGYCKNGDQCQYLHIPK